MNLLRNEFINEITEKIEKLGLSHVDKLLEIDIDHHIKKIIATEGTNQLLIFIEHIGELSLSRQGPFKKIISFTETDLAELRALALESAIPVEIGNTIINTYYGPSFITTLIEDIMKYRTETTEVIERATNGKEKVIKFDAPLLLEDDLKMLQELKRDLAEQTYPCNIISVCAYFGVLRFLKIWNNSPSKLKNISKDNTLWENVVMNAMQLLEPYVGPMTVVDVKQLLSEYL
jgi:hypothetical protein